MFNRSDAVMSEITIDWYTHGPGLSERIRRLPSLPLGSDSDSGGVPWIRDILERYVFL